MAVFRVISLTESHGEEDVDKPVTTCDSLEEEQCTLTIIVKKVDLLNRDEGRDKDCSAQSIIAEQEVLSMSSCNQLEVPMEGVYDGEYECQLWGGGMRDW